MNDSPSYVAVPHVLDDSCLQGRNEFGYEVESPLSPWLCVNPLQNRQSLDLISRRTPTPPAQDPSAASSTVTLPADSYELHSQLEIPSPASSPTDSDSPCSPFPADSLSSTPELPPEPYVRNASFKVRFIIFVVDGALDSFLVPFPLFVRLRSPLVLLGFVFCWTFVLLLWRRGQTPSMWLWNVFVVFKNGGSRVDWGSMLARRLIALLFSFPMMRLSGLYLIFYSYSALLLWQKGRTLTDIALGHQVVVGFKTA